jgi:hypothetical protein
MNNAFTTSHQGVSTASVISLLDNQEIKTYITKVLIGATDDIKPLRIATTGGAGPEANTDAGRRRAQRQQASSSQDWDDDQQHAAEDAAVKAARAKQQQREKAEIRLNERQGQAAGQEERVRRFHAAMGTGNLIHAGPNVHLLPGKVVTLNVCVLL